MVTENLSLSVSTGEIHALIGPNGAGKSTALAQLAGELNSDQGSVWLDGVDVTKMSLPQRVHAGIARSYQISSVFANFSVGENVEMALQARDRHSFRFFKPASANRARIDLAREMLDAVGLGELNDEPAKKLAHGQTRQLEIAMALASEPKILLLDEPMAGMAPDEAAKLAQLLRALAAKTAILLVEHDMDVVFSVADRISVLCEGAIIASGEPAQIKADPNVRRLYLGDDFES